MKVEVNHIAMCACSQHTCIILSHNQSYNCHTQHWMYIAMTSTIVQGLVVTITLSYSDYPYLIIAIVIFQGWFQ